jgi:uncharacterized membrane protein YeaQ/YmgE (transglycosylase-associated protein family)
MDFSLSSADWSIATTILFGALCGYIASRILGGEGFGCLGNIAVGIIGGLIGSWFSGIGNIPLPKGILGNFIASVGGAIILIFFIELIKYLQAQNRANRKNSRRKRN